MSDTSTIKSEITRIQNNIDNTLAAIESKGVTVAADAGSDEMAAYVMAINTGESIPDYVRTEADRVAKLVQSRQGVNTITFLACSDIHHSTVNYPTQMKETLTHLGQGMKLIREQIAIDFAACFGDSIWDGTNETVEDVQDAIREVNAALFPAFNGVPNFRMIGNHEPHYNGSERLTAEQVYAKTAAFNVGATFDEDNRISGYCYRDFEDRKLRVVCLNTSEKDLDGGYTMTNRQIEWLGGVLDLSDLGEGWKSIILSHIPLDWLGPDREPLSTVAQADGVLCNVHGHIHNYLAGKLEGTEVPRFAIPNGCFYRSNEYGENGTTEWNGMEFGETTTYGKTAGTANDTAFCVVTLDLDALIAYADRYGAGYDREITLPGVVVTNYTNVIPTSEAHDSTDPYNGTGYCDGKYLSSSAAPYEGTDTTTFITGYVPSGITDYLSTPPTFYIKGVDLSAPSSHARMGAFDGAKTIKGVVSLNEETMYKKEKLGYKYWKLSPLWRDDRNMWAIYHNIGIFDYVRFSLDGIGAGVVITINEPIENAQTGPEYTNLVPTALAFDGSGSVFNGTGYMNGMYLSTTAPHYNTDANTVTVGLIPYGNVDTDMGSVYTPPTIYIKGVTVDLTNSHNRIGVSRNSDNGTIINAKTAPVWNEVFNVETLGEQYYRLTPLLDDTGHNLLYTKWSFYADYLAFSFTGTGENLIITLDEPIEDSSVGANYTNLADASVQSTAPTSTADKNWWIGYRINSSKAAVAWDADGVVTNLIRIRDDSGNMLVNNLMHIKGLDCKTDGNFHFYDKSGNYLSYSGGVASNSAVAYATYDSDVITVTSVFLYPSSNEYFVRVQGHLTGGVGSSDSVIITADEKIV